MRSLTSILFILIVVTACSVKSSSEERQNPNILFCIADDASMNSFGAYGCDWIKTPAVDRLAKEGAVFTNAYNCNPKCAQARACLDTGMYSWQLKEACNLKLLKSQKSGRIDENRDYVLLGKERHDVGRANDDGIDLAYPVRAIRNDKFLYAHNIKPERWPVGNPEYGFRNCDGSPTKSYLMDIEEGSEEYKYFEMSFGMRPEEGLYNIQDDPDCINNLATLEEYAKVKIQLRQQMEAELREQGDPRTLGNGDVFDKYPYGGRQLDYNIE